MKSKETIKRWLHITIKYLCVLYYLQFILLFYAVIIFLSLSGEDLKIVQLLFLVAWIVVIIFSAFLVGRIIYKHKKNRSANTEVLIFNIISLTSVIVFSGSLLPSILIIFLDNLMANKCGQFLYKKETENFVISFIVYICIICYLLKDYRDKKCEKRQDKVE